MRRLEQWWYTDTPAVWPLLPLSWLFCLLGLLRRALYRLGWLRSMRLPVPVVVAGNLTVGGSGKTPLVIWLAAFLRRHGYQPGIVTRGYGGRAATWPQAVLPDSDPAQVGDEPVLLARRTACPVVAAPDRVAAARQLLRDHGCDVILADDGLQHYRLRRDVEIAVIDGGRRFGNGHCLPAGPLREPAGRLAGVDFVVATGTGQGTETVMELQVRGVVNLGDGRRCDLADFRGQQVHAVCGIGHPGRFFATLRAAGIEAREHPFPDHHAFRRDDLAFADDLPVLMTEKDAVKCQPHADGRCWAVAVDAHLPEAFGARLLDRLKTLKR